MTACPKCGTENDDAAGFCANCGASNAVSAPFKFSGGAIFGGIVVGILIPFGYVFVQLMIVGLGENTPCSYIYPSIAVSAILVLALVISLVRALQRRRPGGQFVVALTITALTILAFPVTACSVAQVTSILKSACSNRGTVVGPHNSSSRPQQF